MHRTGGRARREGDTGPPVPENCGIILHTPNRKPCLFLFQTAGTRNRTLRTSLGTRAVSGGATDGNGISNLRSAHGSARQAATRSIGRLRISCQQVALSVVRSPSNRVARQPNVWFRRGGSFRSALDAMTHVTAGRAAREHLSLREEPICRTAQLARERSARSHIQASVRPTRLQPPPVATPTQLSVGLALVAQLSASCSRPPGSPSSRRPVSAPRRPGRGA